MNDMSNLQAIFGEVQSLQSRLKSKVADAEASADKFKAAFQAAVNPESKDSIVTALKDAVTATTSTATTTSQGSSLADQIQATLSALQDQLQSKLAGPVAAAAAAASSALAANNTASASTSSSTTAAAPPPVSGVSTASATSSSTTVAAVPPAAAPSATAIATINTTHAPYRVYDPSNPSAFVEPSNPGGGPNLLASDLVFNPDPRPDSPLSAAMPTAAYGSAEWKQQSQTYQATYEKLCADNNDWNQKNIKLRTQTLLASPYAAFAGYQGANAAAASDPYTIASLAGANKMAV